MQLRNINDPVIPSQGVLSQIFVRVVSALLVCLVMWVFAELFGD